MGAGYSHPTRPNGTTLTETIYNQDHQNHIDNATPSLFDDYSTNTAQMRSTADPGEVGSENLPTSLAGEIERLRFALQEIKGSFGAAVAQWYATGYRIQMGRASITSTDAGAGDTASGTVTFTEAFASTPVFFMAFADSDNGEGQHHILSGRPASATTANVHIRRVSGVGSEGVSFFFYWIAIGQK